MRVEDVIDIITTIERRFPVATWKASGIRIWPLIRRRLGFELQHLNDSGFQAEPTKSKGSRGGRSVAILGRLAKRIAEEKKASWADRRPGSEIAPVDCLILTHSIGRFMLDGTWFNIYSDPFVTALKAQGLTSLTLEWASGSGYQFPRYRPSRLIDSDLQKIDLQRVLLKRFRPAVELFLPEIEGVRAFLQERAGKSKSLTTDVIGQQADVIRRYADYFKTVLAKTKPRMAFVVTHYDIRGMAFTLACHEAGVLSVDIQHGVQGDYHVSYGSWVNVPQDGYELLPDRFWCWNPADVVAIDRWSKALGERHRGVHGGNLWFQFWRDTKEGVVQAHMKRLADLRTGRGGKLHILWTLQPGYPSMDLFLESVKTSPADWIWWLRMHPRMTQERDGIKTAIELSGLKHRIIFDETIGEPLPPVLQQVDVHGTLFSSTVQEARMVGKPSVICHPLAEKVFKEEIREGWAVSATTPLEIIKVISNFAGDSRFKQATNASAASSGQAFAKLLSEAVAHGA